ncbi:hypothetical protein EDD86DRAFT_129479 [Gorgonomyces haynaldii]|nr:hypothetical protein EDD86DRAFT_129479 [Gorgonomyces haynaldii]
MLMIQQVDGLTTVQTASFMVNWAVVCIVCLFCMFYSQRIIARLISLVIGFWMWRRYKISLHIGSITPVWLRGRVYFKNMSILSKDYIVQVHKGYIQFRYWKSYKQNDAHETVMNEDGSIRPIPFFSTRLDGFELFLFNRSGVYRNLETLLQNKEILLQPMISSIHFSWPVEFHSRKGAVIVGNPDLPNIATFSYEVLVGLYCHKPTVDGTRTSFKIQFDDTKLSVGHNVDYKEQTLNYAARLRSRITDKTIWERLSTLFRKKRLEEIPMSEPYEWHGLDRYRKSFDKSSSEGEEYAQVSEIIQAKQLGLQYYWNSAETITSVGLDISLTDSKIHYGPWANRQRLILQSYFSPNAYRDAKLGNAAPCFFNVLITFKNKTVLRIPFREQSEDPQYSNKTEGPLTKKKPIRPFGWIDLKFADDSTIGMDIPLIPSKQRYETALRIALRDVVAHSSSNHALFFESTSFVVQVDYKSGLSWNASRECMISLDTMDMNMFFLRDHADLIQDFVNDFSSGSPPTIETFVPCIYHLEVNASNLNLNLCLNDKNIIDNHNSFLDNVYLILKSRQLQFNMTLPFVNFNPSERSLDFQIALQENDLDFSFPLNHKIGSFLNPRKQKFGLLSDCQVKGFFNYCTRQSRPSNLMLEVNIIDPDLTLFGFSLPLLSHLVSNYFGENTRFRRQGEDLLPKAINGNGVELSLDLVMLNVNGNLPDKLYNSQHTLQIKCTKLQLSLQSNASGLDLNLQTSPIKIMDSKEALLLKSVCLELQRLQSPKAHYCSNWNMMISTIGGSFGPTFIKSLVDFSECFLYHMNDHQKISGLPKPKPFSPLLLLFSLSIENIDCAYTVDQKIARFSVKDGVHMHYNNLLERGTTFLVAVPSVSLSWLQASEARGNQDVYGAEVFRIESALTFTKTYFPENHRELWINQKEFLETHDQDKRLRKLFNHKEKPTDFRLPVFFAPHFIHNFISRSRKEKKTSLGLARAPNGFQNHLLADYVRIYKFVKPFDGSETPSYAGELVRSPEELLTVNRNALKTNIPTPSPPNDEEIVFLDFNLHDCLELLITPQTVEFVKSSLEALSVFELKPGTAIMGECCGCVAVVLCSRVQQATDSEDVDHHSLFQCTIACFGSPIIWRASQYCGCHFGEPEMRCTHCWEDSTETGSAL